MDRDCLRARGARGLTAPEKMLREVKEHLATWVTKGMIPQKDLRSTAGRLSWIAGILPHMRWAVSAMYAALADAERDDASGAEVARAAGRADHRPKQGLIAVKRFGASLSWLLALLQTHETFLHRVEPLQEERPKFGIVTDASPRGLGAILIRFTSQAPQAIIDEAIHCIVTETDATILQVPFGEAASQSTLELMALVRGVQRWGPRLKGQPVVIRSDSTAALAATRRLASRKEVMNLLGGELAIHLEELGIPRLVTQHVAGRFNKETDWLSRPHEAKTKPTSLDEVKIVRCAALKDSLFRMALPGLRKDAKSVVIPDKVWEAI